MSKPDLKQLLDRYLNGSLSREELLELLTSLQKEENTDTLEQAIQKALADNRFSNLSDPSRIDTIFRNILQQAKGKRIRLWRWTTAAAALLIFLSGIYFYNTRRGSAHPIAAQTPPAHHTIPGHNKAILQLADSSSIVLDDTNTGLLAQQGNTKILKLNNGQLAYNTISDSKTTTLFNTVSTPRGGQYQIVLPDGSKVWLNAASSLRFPTAFTGTQRNVTLSGEGYFEIAPNKDMPFIVQTGDLKVEVLGTSFNVMSYSNDDAIHTTLLSGAVRISSPTGSTGTLKPGQQASFLTNTRSFTVREADIESVTAWKNGLFQFNGDNIQTIMRQIERWYDVDVYYPGPIPEGHFSGTVGRDKDLLKVLRILEESDLKFTINGKKLTVL